MNREPRAVGPTCFWCLRLIRRTENQQRWEDTTGNSTCPTDGLWHLPMVYQSY